VMEVKRNVQWLGSLFSATRCRDGVKCQLEYKREIILRRLTHRKRGENASWSITKSRRLFKQLVLCRGRETLACNRARDTTLYYWPENTEHSGPIISDLIGVINCRVGSEILGNYCPTRSLSVSGMRWFLSAPCCLL